MDKSPKEFSMKKHILLTLLTVTLVTSMLFVSCGKDPDEELKKALEGTWIGEGEEITFNNGTFEIKEGGTPSVKGTYTVSDSTLILTPTHFWGALLGLSNRWYSKAEVKENLKQQYINLGFEWTADADRNFEENFKMEPIPFSISGNTLTITSDGYTSTYTKK
jgi:hypothetical protein